MKTIKGYIVCDPTGEGMIRTIASTERGCKASITFDDPDKDWKKAEQRGYTMEPITITAGHKPKGAANEDA